MDDIEHDIAEFNTIIIGSGAAGLNCALHLEMEGLSPTEIAIITEKIEGGTSFNSGSDKQTYYKMSLIGKSLDSPYKMAQDFYKGGAMHGDIALIETTNSIREFFHLVSLGVNFPHDKYGAYIGYKTDNDPRQRATSIGPLTSQKMGECLLREVKRNKIPIFDNHYAVKIIIEDIIERKRAIGVICLELMEENLLDAFRIFKAENIILATGGPAIIYKDKVYPKSQTGSNILAIEAGCRFQNLTESQFGLASLKFRWNLSGSYQQVIPRYFSMDKSGQEFEFLNEIFPSFIDLSKAVFLKGYQWPFNSSRIEGWGSSIIDLAVYYQKEQLNRKVFLDYRKNPLGYDQDKLHKIAQDYLKKSGVKGLTPLERLLELNINAYELFKENEIDLASEPLEIGICNQHLNGGILGDIWWETDIKHLFAIGEVNGSHGIHRPGGAALNSGQVGGLRAAQKIANIYYKENSINSKMFKIIAKKHIEQILNEINYAMHSKGSYTPNSILIDIRNRMSDFGSIVRPLKFLNKSIEEVKKQIYDYPKSVRIKDHLEILKYFRVKDALFTHFLFLKAIQDYHSNNGVSRGSYLILRDSLNANEKYIIPPKPLDQFKFISNKDHLANKIQTIKLKDEEIYIKWEYTRQIPEKIAWFETTWKKYKNKDIFH